MPRLENFRLKVFRSVAKHLSFRKAAEHLFITQPAVTLQIKALESELGVRLFDRRAGRIALTEHGSILLGYANKIAAIAAEAEQQLSDEHDLVGKFTLGVSTTIAQYVLPHLLATFLSENPRVRLSLRSGNTHDIVQLLLEEKIPVGLIEGPAREKGVHTKAFMQDELVLVAARNFAFDHISPERLREFTLLMREQGSGTRQVVETALRKSGVRLKEITKVIDLDSTEAIKSAVQIGLGVGFVSRWAIFKELELGILKVVNLSGVKIKRDFTLVMRTGPEPQGPAGTFCAFALDAGPTLAKAPRKL
jgi:LysR family transcriptional regulator, transcriptional activator of the cysJI operon